MNSENRILQLLGVSSQAATHIRLVRGVVVVNPHLQVLCPTLAKGNVCHRGGRTPKEWHRPKLLMKNFGDSGLQLWMCEGCRDKFILRVEIQKLLNICQEETGFAEAPARANLKEKRRRSQTATIAFGDFHLP